MQIIDTACLEELEDAYWGELATKANKEKSLGVEETMQFLLEDD